MRVRTYANRGRSSWRNAVSSAALLGLIMYGCSDASEDDGSLRGELIVHVADYDDAPSETHYFLTARNGKELELRFKSDPQIPAGTSIRVRGRMSDGAFRVEEFDYEQAEESEYGMLEAEVVNATPRPNYTLAVLMVHFGAPDSQTTDSLRQKVFGGTTSTNAYYKESSYNIQGLSGDVFGWYRINDPGGCNYSTIAQAARTAAQNAGVDLTKYKQFMYYFPRYSACGWAGLGSVGSPSKPARDSWYNGASGCTVLVQELGHNFGLMHSRSCSSQPASGICQSYREYGDPFCPMGSGCFQMNVVQKGEMGWFGKCNVVTATSSGVFDVAPLEMPSDSIQALRIARGDGRYLYIENRMALGKFDTQRSGSSLNTAFTGIMIHEGPEIVPMPSYNNRNPYLLDATPGTSSFQDAALQVGQTFTSGSISIKLESKSSSSAKVRVTVSGGSGGPKCIDGSSYNPGNSGGSGGSGGTGGTGGSSGSGGTGGSGASGGSGGGNTGTGGSGGTGGSAGTGGSGGSGGGSTGTGGSGGTGGSAGTGGTGGSGASGGSGGGTSGTCGAIPAWRGGTNYTAGQVVQNYNRKYECRPWPNSGWCIFAAYEPGKTGAPWPDAWIDRGSCN